MTSWYAADDAATPLTEEEKADLLPSYISFRHELNAAEQANILKAQLWAQQSRQARSILSEATLRELHKRMFSDVWRWAGVFRKTARNIGVDAWKIPTELRVLIEDTCFWIEQQTYELDEIATRFHHRLVLIHPFPNGNGRHARLATDLLLLSQGAEPFTWGQAQLDAIGQTRQDYVSALRQADRGDYQALQTFVRS